MSGNANLIVTNGSGAPQAQADEVMAWARDAMTGEPRYILELDANHRGAKCGCECPSCGKSLTAVNAAKAEFVRRPHFRHPEGAQRNECLVLAARTAALRQLQEDGWLNLPRRRMSARVAGLSGEFHEAWVEKAPVRIRISNVNYRDRATAVVTLDDGRQLRVELTGAADSTSPLDADCQPAATIYMAIDDPCAAALAPEELRRRMRLQPDDLCWRAHWSDSELRAEAEAAARARAHFYYDEVPDWLSLPEGLAPALRRETVLHHEVKRLLEEAARLSVPEAVVEIELNGVDGQLLRDRWSEEGGELRLSCVQLETRYRRLVPDITCESFGTDGHVRHLPLLIEVTVTNPIDQERLGRIQANGEATLEIDLSLAGGRVNRDELRRLVVDEVAIKRWLYHPDLEQNRTALQGKLAKQVADARAEMDARTKWLADRRGQVLSTPVSEIVAEYSVLVTQMFDAANEPDAPRAVRKLVANTADKLAMHGYPEAGDQSLISSGSILAGVLSIMLGRPVGYRCDNLMDVLNAIRQTSGTLRCMFSIYFIAARAYPPDFTPQQQEWFDGWADEVRHSIQAGNSTYLRDPAFDRLLSLLFPKMAAGLAKPFGKLKPGAEVRWNHDHEMFARSAFPTSRRADSRDTQPQSDRKSPKMMDTTLRQGWLKGPDLEAWKRANPEAAQAWFRGQDEG